MDSRHNLMKKDQQMIDWLNLIGVDYNIVLSKIDKLSKKDQKISINNYKTLFPQKNVIPFSIKNKQYIKNIRTQIISDLLENN